MQPATFIWYKWTDLQSNFPSYDINQYNIEFTLWTDKWDDMFSLKLVNIKSTPDILGAFAKFRKATISFVMSVRPSVRPSVHM